MLRVASRIMASFSTPPSSKRSLTVAVPPSPPSKRSGLTLITEENLALWAGIPAPLTLPGVLTVLSYNVWMSHVNLLVRHRNLVSVVLEHRPEVVMLQEFLPWFAQNLRASPLSEEYHISPTQAASYGNLTLIRKEFVHSVKFEDIPLTTNMGRSCLLSTIEGSLGTMIFANMHFESLDSEALRKTQLGEVKAAILPNLKKSDDEDGPSPPRLVLLGGDFNFDDRQTWGDWARSPFAEDDSAASSRPLENVNIETIMHPDFADAWLHLDKDSKEVSRYTFDGKGNPNVKDKREQMRYDRFLVARSAGVESLEDVEILTPPDVSDHFGLKAVFRFH
mmetsp:Transcript_8700/g.17459  ORF Transcript_8700/g.17459 Transcript_8700/m.17459 type:complete len:335 (-) Transcript_8700:35-1039(-)